MTKGPLVTAVIAGVAMVAVIGAFATNASPYVTIREARQRQGDRLHLAGDLIKSSISNNVFKHELRFDIKDGNGDQIQVVYTGDVPSNLGDAERIVAVGGIQGDHFQSKELIVKCPSKYEGEDSKKGDDAPKTAA